MVYLSSYPKHLFAGTTLTVEKHSRKIALALLGAILFIPLPGQANPLKCHALEYIDSPNNASFEKFVSDEGTTALNTDEGAFLQNGSSSATIPFDIRYNEIVIKARINDQLVSLILDSGSGGLGISGDTAKDLNLIPTAAVEIDGVDRKALGQVVHLDTLEIPNAIRISNLTATILPLPKAIAGIIGYDILSRFVTRIDFPNQKITFMLPSSFHPSATEGARAKLTLNQGLPIVEGSVDESAPGLFLIDTGDYLSLLLSMPFVKKYDIDHRYSNGIPAMAGEIGGMMNLRMVKLKSFQIGSCVESDVAAALTLKAGSSPLPGMDGGIGVGFLSRFVVTFDYSNKYIYLSRLRGKSKDLTTKLGNKLDEGDYLPETQIHSDPTQRLK